MKLNSIRQAPELTSDIFLTDKAKIFTEYLNELIYTIDHIAT